MLANENTWATLHDELKLKFWITAPKSTCRVVIFNSWGALGKEFKSTGIEAHWSCCCIKMLLERCCWNRVPKCVVLCVVKTFEHLCLRTRIATARKASRGGLYTYNSKPMICNTRAKGLYTQLFFVKGKREVELSKPATTPVQPDTWFPTINSSAPLPAYAWLLYFQKR